METVIEVVKLKQQTLNGSKVWVMSKEDFIRLVSKYKLTLAGMRLLGISRAVWDNTLAFHGWDVNKIEGFRKTPYQESHHGNSGFGFSSIIDYKVINRVPDTKIQAYLDIMEKHFPGFTALYAAHHEDPTGVSKELHNISRTLIELNSIVKLIHHRVRKWASRVDKPYYKLVHNNLNHAFSKILDELGLEYLVEYGVGPYFFDFYVPKYELFIEVDGGGHIKNTDKDKEKAIPMGSKLLRIKVRDKVKLREEYERIKNKISKECGF